MGGPPDFQQTIHPVSTTKPSREDYAHAFRIRAQLRYLDEELKRIADTRDALDKSMNAAITQRVCLLQELEYLIPAE